MARSASSLFYYISNRRLSESFRGFFYIPTSLALITCISILFYISSTSKLVSVDNNSSKHHHHHHQQQQQQSRFLQVSPLKSSNFSLPSYNLVKSPDTKPPASVLHVPGLSYSSETLERDGNQGLLSSQGRTSSTSQVPFKGKCVDNEVFHDKDIFLEDYKEMNRSFKIYVYPHRKDEPFAHALLPVNSEPGGNYASESYFKKVLMESHFITKDPSEADLFFLPFSIARLRNDPLVSVGGIKDFVKSYIFNISHKYPYWNRTGGADHFYVACHSVGRTAMDKADEVKFNAIQAVCSSSYYLSGYIAHKDASVPQIWPRKGDPPNVDLLERKTLAFFAGAMNSPVRTQLIETWRNDSEIFVNLGRLRTPYSEALLGSKFCLHVKGFEVNTARIGDALYYGCVPVIVANYYDLPFADILNWKSFSLVVPTLDIPLLKKILQGVSADEYANLQSNVMKVRRHFRWNLNPVDYDAFYMVMYELWLRRSSIRTSLSMSEDLEPDHKNVSSGKS